MDLSCLRLMIMMIGLAIKVWDRTGDWYWVRVSDYGLKIKIGLK